MLIPLKDLVKKYNLTISGILHVGAHLMEEKKIYDELGVDFQVWVEADPETSQKIRPFQTETCRILNYVIAEEVGKEVVFHRTNNRQSSSILNLKNHTRHHPTVFEESNFFLRTETLEHLIDVGEISLTKINFLNLDIQGVELEALKGLGPYLKDIDYIYTEVNIGEVYEGNSLLPDLDLFLTERGFSRVETCLTPWEWGDAFYIRL